MRYQALLPVLALLLACSPPAQAPAPEPTPPAPFACNAVAPDQARQIAIGGEAVTGAAAAADLRGGRIAPGVYNLVSATRIGDASGWTGTRAIALAITEGDAEGVVFNWAGAASSGETDRWTASFAETPAPRLTYTCGRIGDVPADFAVEAGALELRLQDGAGGQLALVFQPRP